MLALDLWADLSICDCSVLARDPWGELGISGVLCLPGISRTKDQWVLHAYPGSLPGRGSPQAHSSLPRARGSSERASLFGACAPSPWTRGPTRVRGPCCGSQLRHLSVSVASQSNCFYTAIIEEPWKRYVVERARGSDRARPFGIDSKGCVLKSKNRPQDHHVGTACDENHGNPTIRAVHQPRV